MVNDGNILLMEVWAHMKSHIQPKERLDAADTLVAVFDEYGLITDEILTEDLDKQLSVALNELLGPVSEDEDDDYGIGDDDEY